MRFWPGWSWLKTAIEDGRYGKVLAARFRRVSGPPGWSKGTYFKGAESGGALLDLHIHDTDFIQFLFGRPTSVFSACRIRIPASNIGISGIRIETPGPGACAGTAPDRARTPADAVPSAGRYAPRP